MSILDAKCPICNQNWTQLSPYNTECEIANEIYSNSSDQVWKCSAACRLTVFYTSNNIMVVSRFNDADNTVIYWFVDEPQIEIHSEGQDSKMLDVSLPYNITKERLTKLLAFL